MHVSETLTNCSQFLTTIMYKPKQEAEQEV